MNIFLSLQKGARAVNETPEAKRLLVQMALMLLIMLGATFIWSVAKLAIVHQAKTVCSQSHPLDAVMQKACVSEVDKAATH